MAEQTEKERQKLFAEIMKSLKEYTKENIVDTEAVKSEIVKLLKTRRPVKLVDYEFGLSLVLKKDHHIIVKEKDDKTKVKVFTKSNASWMCSSTVSGHHKCGSGLKIKYGIVFVPNEHSKKCKAKNYSFVLEIQELLRQGKRKEALSYVLKRKPMNNDSSLSTSTPNELNLSTTSDIQNESALEYTISEDTIQNTGTTPLAQESSSQEALQESSVSLNVEENNATNSDTNSTTLSQQSSSPVSTEVAFGSTVNSSIKREFNDSDYCMVIDEPAAKKQKTETCIDETFPFDLPSKSILKEICDKLKIDYHRDAYKFWGDIAFENVPVFSQNIQTHSIKSSNIFICLSLFFTGEITKCYLIQDTIYTAFRDELIAKGSIVEKADQLFACTTVSDKHLKFVAKFLSCRIGIYEDAKIKRYGNGENENGSLALILSFVNGMYSVVLDM